MSKQPYPKFHTKKIIIVTAIILNFLFGYAAYHSTLDGKAVTIIDWLFLMIAANIMCIIPICLIILLCCKLKNRAIERAKTKAQNTVQSKNDSLATNAPKQPIPAKEAAIAPELPPLPTSTQEQTPISLPVTTGPQRKALDSAHQELLKKYAIITPLDTTNFTDFDFFVEAGMLCIEHFSDPDKITLLQRHLGIGVNRAIRICDQLVYHKVLSSKGLHYDVIMDRDSFYALISTFHEHVAEESDYIINDKLLSPSNMSGQEFEEQCAELLKKNGFANVTLTPGSGDHGADILAEKDGISYAFQCKYYSNTVGNSAVQEAHSARTFYEKDIAVVITNSYFTHQAQEEAAKNHVKLWDKDTLRSLLKSSQSTSDPT